MERVLQGKATGNELAGDVWYYLSTRFDARYATLHFVEAFACATMEDDVTFKKKIITVTKEYFQTEDEKVCFFEPLEKKYLLRICRRLWMLTKN
jgi:hypothetical protein